LAICQRKAPFSRAGLLSRSETVPLLEGNKRRSLENALFNVIADHEGIHLFSSSVDSWLFRTFTEDEKHVLTGGHPHRNKVEELWGTDQAVLSPVPALRHSIYRFCSAGDKVESPRAIRNGRPATIERNAELRPRIEVGPKLADDMVLSDPKKVALLQTAVLAA
jgi:hypothetical protein